MTWHKPIEDTDEEVNVKKLSEHVSKTPSKWRERVKFRHENKDWLSFSRYIALKMLEKMDAENISQKDLAERLNCSQQYVSKILKGCENLSLETIFKIETALDLVLMPRTVEVSEVV
ncbi:MAG: helix-turn-helix transcriptional regulator [Bacteroidales bacterium]|nr:helix-turn-helix transcriptional regulator [Bacteroidales bacterium]